MGEASVASTARQRLRPFSYLGCSCLRFQRLDLELAKLKSALKTCRDHLLLQDSSRLSIETSGILIRGSGSLNPRSISARKFSPDWALGTLKTIPLLESVRVAERPWQKRTWSDSGSTFQHWWPQRPATFGEKRPYSPGVREVPEGETPAPGEAEAVLYHSILYHIV